MLTLRVIPKLLRGGGLVTLALYHATLTTLRFPSSNCRGAQVVQRTPPELPELPMLQPPTIEMADEMTVEIASQVEMADDMADAPAAFEDAHD